MKAWTVKIYQLPSSSEWCIRLYRETKGRVETERGYQLGSGEATWKIGVVHHVTRGQVQTSNWISWRGAHQVISKGCSLSWHKGQEWWFNHMTMWLICPNSSLYNYILVGYSFVQWFSPCISYGTTCLLKQIPVRYSPSLTFSPSWTIFCRRWKW